MANLVSAQAVTSRVYDQGGLDETAHDSHVGVVGLGGVGEERSSGPGDPIDDQGPELNMET
ncbi:hypothetical protein E4U52_003129 [Claviceps spartinae]|nr:hypothetical protein E4U52_003129 [Claviceps spartinae]KAG6079637.1 hypothetical protein E4U15_003672 [Claviceps sp. LM218 group G6]